MCGTADPPLGSRDSRRMDDELVGSLVKGSGGLEPSNVRPMTQLGHCEAADQARERQGALAYPVLKLGRRRGALQYAKEQAKVHAKPRPEPRIDEADYLHPYAKDRHWLVREVVNLGAEL